MFRAIMGHVSCAIGMIVWAVYVLICIPVFLVGSVALLFMNIGRCINDGLTLLDGFKDTKTDILGIGVNMIRYLVS